MPLIERRFLLNVGIPVYHYTGSGTILINGCGIPTTRNVPKSKLIRILKYQVGDLVYLSDGKQYKITSRSNDCFVLKNQFKILTVNEKYLLSKLEYLDILKQKTITTALNNLESLEKIRTQQGCE